MSSRSGSPSVRMIVARSRAAASGWGILSRGAPAFSRPAASFLPGVVVPVTPLSRWPTAACMPPYGTTFESSKTLEISKEGSPRHVLRSHLRHLPRRTLSPRLAYALVGGIIGLALFASSTPSPLYGIYRQLWGFSPAVLTLVYATYAFGVLAALVLAGRVSDEVGRRPVLLVALGDADRHHRPLHGGRLGRLAVRGPRPAGPGDRRGARRRQRRAAGPAPAARPARRRPDQRRRQRRRHGPRRAGLRARSWSSCPRRGCCPTSRCSCSSRSPLPAWRSCPSPSPRAPRPRLTPQRPGVPAVVAPPVLPGRARRDVLVVDRRPVPVARAGALGEPVPDDNHLVSGVPVFALAGSAAIGQLVFGRTAAVGRRGRRIGGAGRRPGDHRARRGDRTRARCWSAAASSAASASASPSSARCARCRRRSRPSTAAR